MCNISFYDFIIIVFKKILEKVFVGVEPDVFLGGLVVAVGTVVAVLQPLLNAVQPEEMATT